MSERKDLTRWNRASLNRFRYVDGNAVEYLEILRQKLVKKFPQSTGQGKWLNPAEEIPSNEIKVKAETLTQRQERLSRKQDRILDMYHQDRRDWAWEISRTFARACHILTEHSNAYANEGYLGTATQWDNVRKLVEMLDYHPAPPASATTPLVFVAKENKSGIVKKGFQVKNSPAEGEAKVVFETLEDLFIDSELNRLRPKGWNQSEEPAAKPLDNNGEAQPPVGDEQFSNIANGSAIHIQGVGEKWALQLNTLTDNKPYKIKDFLNLNPEDSGIILDPEDPDFVLDPNDPGAEIGVIRLREFKAKATAISNFELEACWSEIANWLLPRIASESPESLAEITGNPLDKVEALQLGIELIGTYLDHEVYEIAKLVDLVVPVVAVAVEVVTSWRAEQKPKVNAGDIAMVYREYKDVNTGQSINEAEAATIGKVNETTGFIGLIPSPVQNDWTTKWSKGESRLKVSPRWKRKCWLNGTNVIRTKEPHGLTVGTFIGWNADWNTTNEWNYSKIEYAEIVEADKRNLRLKYGYALSLIDNTDDLVDKGRSLVIVALVDAKLHIRIFDAGGEKVVDKAENELLRVKALTTIKQQLDLFPYESDLSQEKKQKIIEDAALCAGYALLPEENTALIELRPIDDPIVSADYEEIVLLNRKGEQDIFNVLEDVALDLKALPNTDPIFTINDPGLPALGGSGGGLLPPASLPDIGTFLFPSPMLPMDLVKAAVELMLKLGVMQIPSTGKFVIKGLPFGADIDGEQAVNALYDILAGLTIPVFDEDGEPTDAVAIPLVNWTKNTVGGRKDDLRMLLVVPEGSGTTLFQKIKEDIQRKGPLLAIPKEPPIKADVDSLVPRYVVEGDANKIANGDWLVGQFTDGARALKISSVNQFSEERFSLSFEKLVGNEGELQKVYADFRGELATEGAEINNAPIDPKGIELDEVPESLTVGREVLLECDCNERVVAKIVSIDGNIIKTVPSHSGCSKGGLIIYGNVVQAGHGEIKPGKILGSGNAALSNQEFTLEVDGVSFIPDATKSSGVAAAIEVEVDGRVWEQVSTLKDSGIADHHYAIRMTEEGYVKILFGDGKHARRLPTGSNNIRVRHRVGTGLTGNVSAGGLEKPVNPNPLVEKIHQPLPAAGGGDMEDVASLRENAPPTVLALERAVSLSDFSHLAAGHSSVWQAKAYSEVLHGGRTESVRVVIVPAGGISSDDIKRDMRNYLRKHALPGVSVKVLDFDPERIDLAVTIRIKTEEFVAREVEKAVGAALKDHFALKNRKLGEHLYLSEVYKVVESIRGVKNSICVLNDDKTLQLIRAGDDSTVVYLDTDAGSTLTVTHEEYQP